jgi:hypothetical protein
MTATRTRLRPENMRQLMFSKLNIPRLDITEWAFRALPMPVFIEPEEVAAQENVEGIDCDECEYVADEVDFGTQYDPNYDDPVDAPEEGSDEEVEEDTQQSQSQSQSSQHY